MRVLVVEDQDDLREVVAETLREESFAVDESADGEEGLYKALNWDYDIVVLDVMMPVMDGVEATLKIRAIESAAQASGTGCPIIALTANAQKDDRDRCIDAGMDDFLTKPIRKAELLDLLNKVLLDPRKTEKPL